MGKGFLVKPNGAHVTGFNWGAKNKLLRTLTELCIQGTKVQESLNCKDSGFATGGKRLWDPWKVQVWIVEPE